MVEFQAMARLPKAVVSNQKLIIVLRIVAHRSAFFRDAWSVFDLSVVAIALVPASGPFAVLRALRVLRGGRALPTETAARGPPCRRGGGAGGLVAARGAGRRAHVADGASAGGAAAAEHGPGGAGRAAAAAAARGAAGAAGAAARARNCWI